MARPERFELPTLCFEGTQYKTLSAASGCRLQRHAPFISLLSWTEDGLKCCTQREPRMYTRSLLIGASRRRAMSFSEQFGSDENSTPLSSFKRPLDLFPGCSTRRPYCPA